MPKIVAAAIKFKPLDSEYYQIMCGERHCNVLELMYKHGLDYHRVGAVQGFLTDEDQFVDFLSAGALVGFLGQMLKDSDTYRKMSADPDSICAYPLFSEDLW